MHACDGVVRSLDARLLINLHNAIYSCIPIRHTHSRTHSERNCYVELGYVRTIESVTISVSELQILIESYYGPELAPTIESATEMSAIGFSALCCCFFSGSCPSTTHVGRDFRACQRATGDRVRETFA